MKRKAYSVPAIKLVKTSVSLPDMLVAFAEQRCVADGHNSFSAYLAHLIRQEKGIVEKAAGDKPGKYPPHQPQGDELNDKKNKKKKSP